MKCSGVAVVSIFKWPKVELVTLVWGKILVLLLDGR